MEIYQEKEKSRTYLPEVRVILENDIYLKWALRMLEEINDKGNTLQHSQRMANLGFLLARHLNYLKEETEFFVEVNVLHDIGKIEIDSSILTKPSDIFSEEDLKKVSQHALDGFGIVERRDPRAAHIILIHHEFQEKPYPKIDIKTLSLPKKDMEIARLLAMIDVFDRCAFGATNIKPLPLAQCKARLMEQFKQEGDEEIIDFLISKYETVKELCRG